MDIHQCNGCICERNGKVVLENNLFVSDFKLDVSGVQEGFYLLNLVTSEGMIQQKVIISH
jgi:hypothetical protein